MKKNRSNENNWLETWRIKKKIEQSSEKLKSEK